jgi:hypothetical protein
MSKVKRIITGLSVIFILFIFLDEGKAILLVVNSIQIHLNHNQNSESEIPHQHNFNKSDDEKWMNSNIFELACLSEKVLLFPHYLNKRTEDYTGLVWQPPKSI